MATSASTAELDAVIVGAGFSGLYTLHKLRGLSRIEAAPEAQADWVAHVNEVADATLYPSFRLG